MGGVFWFAVDCNHCAVMTWVIPFLIVEVELVFSAAGSECQHRSSRRSISSRNNYSTCVIQIQKALYVKFLTESFVLVPCFHRLNEIIIWIEILKFSIMNIYKTCSWTPMSPTNSAIPPLFFSIPGQLRSADRPQLYQQAVPFKLLSVEMQIKVVFKDGL